MPKRWAGWPRGNRWLAGIAAVMLGLAIAWVLLVPIADWLAHHDVGSVRGPLHETAVDNARGRLLTLAAGLLAAGALVFTARSFWLSREGQVTDRYTKAIEQLGSDKLDVRIGGIYALERVARDSARDHSTVMEVLTAFIREHSREPWPPSGPDGAEPERMPRSDVQAAVTVVGRRNTERDWRLVDLTEAYLAGARLGWPADFSSVHLSGAHLEGAYLQSTRLAGAHLEGAYMEGANLEGALLDGAKLESANLVGATLVSASLGKANLYRANLREARLIHADLADADLISADLTGADLTYAYLPGAHLRGADLTRAVLADTDLTGADLTEAILVRTILTRANLAGAHLAEANLTGAILPQADLTRADLAHANLVGATLADADLTDADLTDTDVARAILPHAKLVRARLFNADLTGAELVGADLTRADLTSAHLTDAKLTGAKWTKGTPVPEGWKLDTRTGRLRAADAGAEPTEAN